MMSHKPQSLEFSIAQMCQCSCWLVFTSVVGIILYLFDVITDITNGIIYFVRGDRHWGIATLVFVFLPVVTYFICLIAYKICECSHKNEDTEHKRWSTTQRFLKIPYWRSTLGWLEPTGSTCCKRFFGYILILCRLESVSSYIECIRLGLRGQFHEIQDRFFRKHQFQIFIETCMESLPQVALQLYILCRKNAVSGFQCLSLVSSIISAWFILMYIQIERIRDVKQKKVWAIKLLWCIFGGIPTLFGSFPSISFFAAVYNPPYLLLYIVITLTLTVKWLFITTLSKYNKLSIRTTICFIVTVIKFGLLLMISLWYISVKNFDPKYLVFSQLNLEDPKSFVPKFIWPNTHSILKDLSLKRSDFKELPPWAACHRKDMFRNGTFVIDTDRWLAAGSLTENILAFLKQEKLFCMYDIAEFIFCTVFYCIIIWIIWDILFYFIRCCVPSQQTAENRDVKANDTELDTLVL